MKKGDNVREIGDTLTGTIVYIANGYADVKYPNMKGVCSLPIQFLEKVMRTISQISDELEKLYSELDIVQSMSEESVRLTFNAECKASIYPCLMKKSIL